jgi:1-aminocyclopropane-1-carboxylate deaminase/D-cysteine desulfhydrase-like pyridoxal-dependent ACC family enzyme
MLALFGNYPSLQGKVPYVSLGDFPTPIEEAERLGRAIHAPRLFVKRDDLSGKPYGGNKVRALEFLLGAALRAQVKEVIALGFPASCQALAQAIYARQVGLRSIAFLFPQVVSQQARQHLLVYQSLGADVRPISLLFPYAARHLLSHGRLPMLLEASTPLGMVGYVSAAFELKSQIELGLLPEPDLVYIALATLGTAVGLMLGFKAASLKCQVIGVDNGGQVLGRKVATPRNMIRLFRESNALLRKHAPAFPEIAVSEADFHIRSDFPRSEASLLNPAGAQALGRARELADLQLDEMFTANAFAAVWADGQAGALRDKTVLWWNTYSSRDLSGQIAGADFRLLHQYFHRYFADGRP